MKKRRAALMILTVLLTVAAVFFLLKTEMMRLLEYRTVDYFFSMRFDMFGSRIPGVDERLCVIAVDEDSLRKNPRSLAFWIPDFAEVLEALFRGGARVVGVDILFSVSEEIAFEIDETVFSPSDAERLLCFLSGRDMKLVKVLSERNIILPFDVVKDGPPKYPDEKFWRSTPGRLAASNMDVQEDGSVRFARPWYSYNGSDGEPACGPSFAFLVFSRFAGRPPGGDIGRWAESFPLDREGRLHINYAGPAGSFPRYSFCNVLERARLRDAGFFRENFSGRIVLIGDVTQDLVNTPFTSRKPHHRTPGVEVQANIINTMLRNAPLRIVPESTAFILLLLLASLAAGVSFRLRPVGGFLLSLTIFAAFIYAAFQLFAHERLLLPCASAALAVLMVYSSTSCAKYFLEEREKRRTREIFSRYAPREAVERILDDYGSLRLKGDRLEITVLFADINGFTPLAERQSSEETIAMLNEYFERISGTIAKNQGLIMQYVGDEVMIIFGAPVARAAHAEMGLLTALGMMKDVALLKKEREERGLPGFDIKIGINSGEVVLGTLGSSRRMEYAAVGDVINTASRVMGLNKNSDLGISSGILLTERTRELAGPSFKYLSLGNHHLKGKEEEVAVYELVESDASSV